MKLGFEIILYLIILNLVSTLVYAINIPGASYAHPIQTGDTGNASAMISQFNSTTLLDKWTATPFSGIPIFGDIFSGIFLFFNAVSWVIAGFPLLIYSYVDLIVDPTSKLVATSVVAVLIAVCFFILFAWFIQLISGRDVSD